ncbi:MAG: hypothetical protein HOP29_02760, partial [Phycisphaerales bacterium]|nr:hypothetical protein [Phycisphaerales bacterium]
MAKFWASHGPARTPDAAVIDGFAREFVEAARGHVGFELMVPATRVKLGEPATESGQIVAREIANGLFDFVDGVHGRLMIVPTREAADQRFTLCPAQPKKGGMERLAGTTPNRVARCRDHATGIAGRDSREEWVREGILAPAATVPSMATQAWTMPPQDCNDAIGVAGYLTTVSGMEPSG